ncbi:SMC-Scp complex subunit ScpB [Amycolatopsis acidicola]|uniref:SMC-Scp complex subunit ScpB n=1 Tax=Amycolatopsis acidicola TaxID=2596893 RepID=UPI003C7BA5A9
MAPEDPDAPEVPEVPEVEAAAEVEGGVAEVAAEEATPEDEPGEAEPESGQLAEREGQHGDAGGQHGDGEGQLADGEGQLADADGQEAEAEQDGEDAELVALQSRMPDLTEPAALESALEALLLVVDSPASEESLAEAVEQPVDRVTEAFKTMSARFTEHGSGIDLRRVGEGWRFFTRDTYAPFVEKLLLDGQRSKLTRAALETLAVIAYRQPVTRARVAAVRGVNVDGVIRTLLARGLIEETGTDPETGGNLYVTTELFLERLGLPSLNDLPPIAPLLPEVDAIDDI